jgi:nucleotide-binding universal stress UspA family protein
VGRRQVPSTQPDPRREVNMFRRILVGFDGSSDAREALRTGVVMASAAEGETTVLIVIPSTHGETPEDRREAFEAEATPIRTAAEHELTLACRHATPIIIRTVTGDHAAEVLARYVQEHGFDLLVVGRHGRERAAHRGLGRMAHELAQKAPCPLLLVSNRNRE